MTMPHLMNCDHSSDGWCLACVQKLERQSEENLIEAGKYEYTLQAIAQRLEPVAHDRSYRAVGLMELPSRVGMLVAEVQQLRAAVKRRPAPTQPESKSDGEKLMGNDPLP